MTRNFDWGDVSPSVAPSLSPMLRQNPLQLVKKFHPLPFTQAMRREANHIRSGVRFLAMLGFYTMWPPKSREIRFIVKLREILCDS